MATSDYSQGGGQAWPEDLGLLDALEVPVRLVRFDLSARRLVRAATDVALRRATSDSALYRSSELARRVADAVTDTHPEVLHVERTRALSLIRFCRLPAVVDVVDPRITAYGQYRSVARTDQLRVAAPEILRAWLDQGPAAREEGVRLAGLPVLVASRLGREALLRNGVRPELVWDVPNTVFPDERAEATTRSANSRRVVGMSGNLSYPPNVLGFHEFAGHVLPLLRERAEADFVLIGSKPHKMLLRAAGRVRVAVYPDVASVPEAIRSLNLRAMVSPQRVSTGFPNRVIDAVYRAGVPIVCSPETVRGAPPGLAHRLPLARGPEEWVAQLQHIFDGGIPASELADLQSGIDATCGPQAVGALLLDAYSRAREASAP